MLPLSVGDVHASPQVETAFERILRISTIIVHCARGVWHMFVFVNGSGTSYVIRKATAFVVH